MENDWFEESKAYKLQRMPVLRIYNAVGMIAWHKTEDTYAKQKLRLLHPLSWPFLVIGALISIYMDGVPETIKSLKYDDQFVWW